MGWWVVGGVALGVVVGLAVAYVIFLRWWWGD